MTSNFWRALLVFDKFLLLSASASSYFSRRRNSLQDVVLALETRLRPRCLPGALNVFQLADLISLRVNFVPVMLPGCAVRDAAERSR